MREGLVGLGHAVDVVLALERAALLGLRIEELAREAVGHRLLPPLARELHEPAHREGAGAGGGHLDRDLVGRTTDAAGADLEYRRQRLDRRLERLDWRRARATRERLERVVRDLLVARLLDV